MNRMLAIVAGLAVVLSASPGAQGPAGQPWDATFRALPKSENIDASMKRLSARPHHVGSPYDKDNAQWIQTQFKLAGWDTTLETFDVLFPTPRERVVELVAPTQFTAKLEEPAVAEDPTSGQKDEQLPTYNAYSIDGDVTAPLVYVNYGRPEDYDTLDQLGISARGAIVIARYGGVVARHQAEGRGRARRDRLPDLFRSERRRLLRRTGVSRRPDAAERRRAARQRDGHAALSGRSR